MSISLFPTDLINLELCVHTNIKFVLSSDQFIPKHRVEFEDVHRLADGQVKHSAEVFYAGSLWKVYYFLVLYLSMLPTA